MAWYLSWLVLWQLSTRIIWEMLLSTEKMSPNDLLEGKAVLYFLDWWLMWLGLSLWVGIPWAGGLGLYRTLVEKTRESKPVCSTPPWLLLSSLALSSCPDFSSWWFVSCLVFIPSCHLVWLRCFHTLCQLGKFLLVILNAVSWCIDHFPVLYTSWIAVHHTILWARQVICSQEEEDGPQRQRCCWSLTFSRQMELQEWIFQFHCHQPKQDSPELAVCLSSNHNLYSRLFPYPHDSLLPNSDMKCSQTETRGCAVIWS